MTGATCAARGRFLALIWPSLQIDTQEYDTLDLASRNRRGMTVEVTPCYRELETQCQKEFEGGQLNLDSSLLFLVFFLFFLKCHFKITNRKKKGKENVKQKVTSIKTCIFSQLNTAVKLDSEQHPCWLACGEVLLFYANKAPGLPCWMQES